MAKYCRYCGTQLSGNARFCPKCGQPSAAEPQKEPQKIHPETRRCAACGQENAAASKFCRCCGQTLAFADTEATGPAQGIRKATGPAPAQGTRKATGPAPGTKPSGSGRKTGIGIGIAASLGVFLIAAIVLTVGKPGKPGKPSQPAYQAARPGAGPGNNSTSGPGSSFASGPEAAEATETAETAEDPAVLTSDELPLRYTKEQRENAPVNSAEVTPKQGSVTCGNVRVDIPSWELEEGGDRLEVRELPEISQGEGGWSIRAYDFSLASGAHEFDSDIRLTIPREGVSGYSGCVWYNEDTGKWEDVYSEVSEDGKYYTVYTDHFSLFGEKQYKIDKATLQMVLDDGTNIDLNHGIFMEMPITRAGNMERKVRIDYERLWNMYRKTNLDHVKDIGRSIDLITAEPKEIAALTEGGYPPVLDTIGEVFGQTGNADSALEIAADLVGNKSPSPEALGKSLAITDVLLTGYKIYAEASSDRTNEYSTALVNTIKNHKMDLTGTAFSVAGALAPNAWNPVFAIVGVSMYAASQVYEYYYTNGIEEWNTKYYPDEGEVFRRFYEDPGVRLYFDSKEVREKAAKDYHVAIIAKPANMDDEKFRKFREVVNRKGLSTYTYSGFPAAFSKLIELYADDPQSLEMVLDDFYHSITWAIWSLPDAPGTKKCPRTDFLNDHKGLGNDPYALPRAEQLKLSEVYFMDLKIGTMQILENVAFRYQRKACEGLIARMEKEFLPVMNKILVFHVRDSALATGQDFSDSVYCVDWHSIASNRRYLSLPDADGSVFDDGFTTPIRFETVRGPVFLPFESDGNLGSERDYYPYAPNFIPRADNAGDVVFRCTFYHYLMMGAPKRMVFKDLKSGKETRAAVILPELDPLDKSRKVDVYVTVQGKKPDVPSINTTLLETRMRDRGQTPSNRVTVSPTGEVTFSLSRLDDHRIALGKGAMAEKDYEIYNRPALTLSGRVVEVDADGRATSSGGAVKIGGSGGASGADGPEKLIIVRGYLTGNPGSFEDHYTRYSSGERYYETLYKVRRVGIAPADVFKAPDDLNMNGYSTFMVWKSKETGAVGATIKLRGDITLETDGGAPAEMDLFMIDLEAEDHCQAPKDVCW